MLRELHFDPILPGGLLVVVIAAVASGAVLASARMRGSGRDSIVQRATKAGRPLPEVRIVD